MRSVWKYPLLIGSNELEMPRLATIVHVGDQDGTPTAWAIVETDAPLERRYFNVYGTGHPILGDAQFLRWIGTAICPPFVWHLFERFPQ